MKIVVLALLAAFVAVGCDKKEEQAAPKPTQAASAKPQADLPRPPVGIAPAEADTADPDDELATTAEYEEEAEKAIDKANVEAEVDKLDKEIGE